MYKGNLCTFCTLHAFCSFWILHHILDTFSALCAQRGTWRNFHYLILLLSYDTFGQVVLKLLLLILFMINRKIIMRRRPEENCVLKIRLLLLLFLFQTFTRQSSFPWNRSFCKNVPDLYLLNIPLNQLLNEIFVEDLAKILQGFGKIILNIW